MRRGFLPVIPMGLMLPVLLIILGLIVFVPVLAITISPELKLLFQIAAVIMIFNWVRNIVGPGMLTYAIAGVLIYIFVFVLPQFTLGVYIVWTIMGLGVFSMLFWGLTLFRMAG